MNTQTPIADTNLPAPVITPVLALVNAALDEGDGLLERARAMAEPLVARPLCRPLVIWSMPVII